MEDYYEGFKIVCSPRARKENIITSGCTRITVLTPEAVRVEVTKNNIFCDEPTQSVWFRDLGEVSFAVSDSGKEITVKTETTEFCCNASNGKMKYILLADKRRVTNFKKGNLKGTKRTLDNTFGSVRLDDGILSRNGAATLCDSGSLVISDDGTIKPRKSDETDIYYFAYGNNYVQAVRDFFRLTGFPPLVPRFVFGNWWSRYKAYTQREYLSLMQRFIKEEIPITVATVDMDWHWVDIAKKFGDDAAKKEKAGSPIEAVYNKIFSSGWTGYSWNTELFPDPQGFIKALKENGFKVTLNLHPASGVRPFEDSYKEFAEFMGDNPNDKKTYPFDITDKKFTEAYFRLLHKPYQDMGVDFWWIDWQQGHKTKTPGLDPLWALNHYHSMDIARDGDRRPLILSRFAGAGSHRYPLGFSGDTAQNWSVLNFQPYFTSTASNIGYTWWSHDIGGHHWGARDDELYLRWVQYGVFSPIMRLHSTSNEFMGKEPWKYSKSVYSLSVESLRLRHRLIPYIYTMNYRTSAFGRALCEPMYYLSPDKDEAYKHPNEYWFGSELIAAPITSPADKRTRLAGVSVYLPEGRFTDIFTGRIYKGGQTVKMFRDEGSIPVLAKQGAIIPLDENCRTNECKNPSRLEVLVYRGNGNFSMYEDDGESSNYKNGAYAFTDFSIKETESGVYFTISPVRNDKDVVPESRDYTITFADIVGSTALVKRNEKQEPFSLCGKNSVGISVLNVKPTDKIEIALTDVKPLENINKKELLTEIISKFQCKNNYKMRKFNDYVQGKSPLPKAADCFLQPLEEIEKLYY